MERALGFNDEMAAANMAGVAEAAKKASPVSSYLPCAPPAPAPAPAPAPGPGPGPGPGPPTSCLGGPWKDHTLALRDTEAATQILKSQCPSTCTL